MIVSESVCTFASTQSDTTPTSALTKTNGLSAHAVTSHVSSVVSDRHIHWPVHWTSRLVRLDLALELDVELLRILAGYAHEPAAIRGRDTWPPERVQLRTAWPPDVHAVVARHEAHEISTVIDRRGGRDPAAVGAVEVDVRAAEHAAVLARHRPAHDMPCRQDAVDPSRVLRDREVRCALEVRTVLPPRGAVPIETARGEYDPFVSLGHRHLFSPVASRCY